MRAPLLAVALLFLCFGIFAQEPNHHCGTTEALEWLYRQDPSARQRVQALLDAAQMTDKTASINQYARTAAVSYTIPVVFHVVHLGGNENISDAQVKDAVNILNRDYSKQNADTMNTIAVFKPIAAKTDIHFALATKDPQGNCTNGITRHYDAVTNWGSPNQSNYKFQWPANKYLNIYVVKALDPGVAGYSFYPGAVPLGMDGIVILHNYVGSIGTASSFGSRSLTHEVGHWLNLAHVWGSNNNPGQACGDDGVSDTPVTKGNSWCNLSAASCSAGVIENVQNYMEYSFCSTMFTQGQATRMQAALNNSNGLRNNIWTNANLIATGVINPLSNCAPKAEYVITNSITCTGQALSFLDASYNGSITSWKWTSPAAQQPVISQNGQLTFTNSGQVSVKLKVSNSFGSDSITKNTIYVMANGVNSATTNVTESFESVQFPDSRWFASLPQYGSGYAKTNLAAATGSSCVYINNFGDNPSEVVNMFTPAYFITNTVNLNLQFKYAYAPQFATNSDRLRVLYSTNCGQNWVVLFNKSGSVLAAGNAPFANGAFVPQASQWTTNTLPLNLSAGTEVYFRFEYTVDAVNGAGNNFYLDDINVGNGGVGVAENRLDPSLVVISPNPATSLVNVTFLSPLTESCTVQIMDVTGRIVMAPVALAAEGIAIDTRLLNRGVYFVNVKYREQKIIKKVVIE